MIPDWYLVLNYKLIDTASPWLADYNWLYLPFNLVEAAIWLFYAAKTIHKYGRLAKPLHVAIQASSFVLFALSDVIELAGTTPLLLLFKLAILLALIIGHQALVADLK